MDTLSNAEKSQNLLEAKRLGDGRLDRNRKRNMLLFSSWWTHNLSISWQSCFTQKSNFKLSLIVVDQECPGCPPSALVTNPSSLPPPSSHLLDTNMHWSRMSWLPQKPVWALISFPTTNIPAIHPPMPMITCISLGPLHPLAWCGVCQSWMVTGAFGYQRIAHWGTRQRWENFSWVKWGGGAWSSDFQLSAF